MKIKVHTFCEDTDDNGTDSRLFMTEEALHAHMKELILDSFDELNEEDGKYSVPDGDDAYGEILDPLNAGDIEEAFGEWTQSGLPGHLDTYNWSSEEIELPEDHPLMKAYKLCETVSRMTQDGEEVNGEEFVMENDDVVSTVNRLIGECREITK
jgi:hypothetical protein